jgi:hypothetical protein
MRGYEKSASCLRNLNGVLRRGNEPYGNFWSQVACQDIAYWKRLPCNPPQVSSVRPAKVSLACGVVVNAIRTIVASAH